MGKTVSLLGKSIKCRYRSESVGVPFELFRLSILSKMTRMTPHNITHKKYGRCNRS